MSTTSTGLARPWGVSGGCRSERSAMSERGVRMIAYRRQAPRGWLWAAQAPGLRAPFAEGRAPTLERAIAAAEEAAERLS